MVKVIVPSAHERERLKHRRMIALYRLEEVQRRVRARQAREPGSTPPPIVADAPGVRNPPL